MEQGKWLVANTFSLYRSDMFFDAKGNEHPQPTYRKYEAGFYTEYGLSEHRTLGGSAQLHALSQRTPQSNSLHLGVADPEFFVRQSVYQNERFQLSFQPLIKLPSDQRYDTAPKAGSRSFDTELSVLGGANFSHRGQWHYLDTLLGYRTRSGHDTGNQWRGEVKLGYRLNPKWLVESALSARISDREPRTAIFSESGDNNYDLIKLESALVYQLLPELEVLAGAFNHAYGKNTGAGYGLQVGSRVKF